MVNPPCPRSAIPARETHRICQLFRILFLSEAPIYLNSETEEKLQFHEWLFSATPRGFNHLRGTRVYAPTRASLGCVFHDVARDCAGRDCEGRRQIHLAGTAAAGEVAVLRADHNLVGTRGNARAGVDAGSATGFDHVSPRLLEDLEITSAHSSSRVSPASRTGCRTSPNPRCVCRASAPRPEPARTCPCLHFYRRCRCRRKRSRPARACAVHEYICRFPDRRAWPPSA